MIDREILPLQPTTTHMARQKRYVKAGEPVHGTARGVDHAKIFRHGHDKRKYLERFALVARQEGVEVHGYCIMDNHIHFLLVPTHSKLAIGRLFLRVHTWWAQHFNRVTGRSGHLFQSRFHSAVLDSAYYFAAMRYIDLNPKAARLVSDPAAFKFSSARAHLTTDVDPFFVLMMDNWRHQFSNNPHRYREFLKETRREEQDRIEKGLCNGFPVGADYWIAQLEQESHRRLHPAPPGRPALLRLSA